MKFKNNFFKEYVAIAPLPLAIERFWECGIMATQDFQHPILDIGCGEGIFALNLLDEKIDVGIEPNARELQRAAELDLYEELIECYGDDIPKPDKSFQTIFSNSVMEHIVDIEPVLKETCRLLKDDGIVYLTLPTDKFDQYSWGYQVLSSMGLNGLAEQYRHFFNRFWNHYHFYDQAKWTLLFEKNGFKVKEHFEYGSKPQCLLNNFATPLCLFAFIVKKITNTWFLFPALRTVMARIFYEPLFSNFAQLKKQAPGKGGLIFFALEKM